MIINSEESRHKRISFKVNNCQSIEDDLAVKVLGWWVTSDGHMRHHTNKIRGPVCNQLSKLKPYIQFLSLKERKELVSSKALSIVKYGLEQYFGQTKTIKDSIGALIMRCYKLIYGRPLEINSNSEWICSQIRVKTPNQLIAESALKLIHRIINKKSEIILNT